jgi:hypothetical protein
MTALCHSVVMSPTVFCSEVVLNWPVERFAVMGITISISLEYIAGEMVFQCPSGLHPVCMLAFTAPPISKFQVSNIVLNQNTQLGSNLTPKVSNFLIQKLQKNLNRVCNHKFTNNCKRRNSLLIYLFTCHRRSCVFPTACVFDCQSKTRSLSK